MSFFYLKKKNICGLRKLVRTNHDKNSLYIINGSADMVA